MKDRRRARRRSLPYVRSAVLEVDGRSHIVAVFDLGPEGAFLATRAHVDPKQGSVLRIVLPRDGREVELPCKIVRRSERANPATGRPAGLAIRFHDLGVDVIRRIEESAVEGLRVAADAPPSDHFEYRLLERSEMDLQELNRLGLDGWRLAAALPAGKGLRLVLLRRL